MTFSTNIPIKVIVLIQKPGNVNDEMINIEKVLVPSLDTLRIFPDNSCFRIFFDFIINSSVFNTYRHIPTPPAIKSPKVTGPNVLVLDKLHALFKSYREGVL